MREIHTNRYGANGRGRRNADLRDYARWEYGRDAEAFLAPLRCVRRSRRSGLRAWLRAWLRPPAIAAVSPTVASVENRHR